MPNYRNLERFLKPQVSLAKNGFPLEQRDVFSTKAGLANCAKVISVVPNDYFEISPTVFIETDRFNNANFTRMSQHLDLFYVPITAIQTRFNEWYQQTIDPQNAIFDMHPLSEQAADNFVPAFHLGSVVYYLAYANSIYNQSKYNDCKAKFLAYDSQYTEDELFSSPYFVDFHAPDLSVIEQYKKLFIGTSQGIHDLAKDKLGYPLFLNTLRLLDMLNYGNYLPIVNFPFITCNADSIIESAKAQNTSINNVLRQQKETFEHFIDTLNKMVNIYQLAAYQSVCHNYFTNPHFERPSVIAYNFDDCDSQDVVYWRLIGDNNFDKVDYIRPLFTMNYTPWKKDIFLSALPSPQFGDVSVVTVISDVLRNKDGSNTLSGNLYQNNGTLRTVQTSGTNSKLAEMSGNFSTIDLVRANALQYWKQQIGRSGYRTNDRFRATFGGTPRHDGRIIPIPIGSVSSQINKNDVVGSSGEDFGERRSLGTSLINNDTIKFQSFDEFGFIVAIYRILPESDYDAFGIDKHHTKFAPFDFFTGAFQNLGLEALDTSEISVYKEENYSNDRVVGYVPRYHEYKSAVDKIHGEFCNMPLTLMRTASGVTVPTVGAFSSLVSSRIDLESYIGSVRQFYVDPAVLDNLFVVDANGEQNTDQFWVTCYLDIKSVRSMSVLGLPQF